MHVYGKKARRKLTAHYFRPRVSFSKIQRHCIPIFIITVSAVKSTLMSCIIKYLLQFQMHNAANILLRNSEFPWHLLIFDEQKTHLNGLNRGNSRFPWRLLIFDGEEKNIWLDQRFCHTEFIMVDEHESKKDQRELFQTNYARRACGETCSCAPPTCRLFFCTHFCI